MLQSYGRKLCFFLNLNTFFSFLFRKFKVSVAHQREQSFKIKAWTGSQTSLWKRCIGPLRFSLINGLLAPAGWCVLTAGQLALPQPTSAKLATIPTALFGLSILCLLRISCWSKMLFLQTPSAAWTCFRMLFSVLSGKVNWRHNVETWHLSSLPKRLCEWVLPVFWVNKG